MKRPKRKADGENNPSSISQHYLLALREAGTWLTVAEWAEKVADQFPHLVQKADAEAKRYKRLSTGLREIAARLSSSICSGRFVSEIEVDESERPKRVRYRPQSLSANFQQIALEEDLETLTRSQRIRADATKLTARDSYRLAEIQSVVDNLKRFFSLDVELEHAKAVLNQEDPGSHHPDNVQVLLKNHNRMKGNNNWLRFTIDEQVAYLEAAIELQFVVSSRLGIEIEESIKQGIFERLQRVF